MIRQVTTKVVSSSQALNSRAFGEGFREAKLGKPFNCDKYVGQVNEQWNYERGRLFAQVYDGDIKKDRRLTYKAQWAFSLALREGIIL
jgi:hypothetical protein